MTDLFSKFDDVIAMREGLLSTGVTDPFGLVMEKVESPTVAICNGKRTILLGTYNYMGMTFDPDVIAPEAMLKELQALEAAAASGPQWFQLYIRNFPHARELALRAHQRFLAAGPDPAVLLVCHLGKTYGT